MCSQPMVQATQLARVRACATPNCSGDRRSACSKVPLWKLRVGSVPKRLNVSRLVAVPSSRYLAVAGPNERFDRSRLNAVSSPGYAHAVRCVPRTANRLDVLAAEHGAAAAAAGMATVVRDGGIAHGALGRRSNRGNPVVGAQPCAQRVLGRLAGLAAQLLGWLEPDGPVVHDQHRQRGRAADDDDGIAAAALARQREAAAGQRVVEPLGQRAAADDGELRGRGERTADERAEREDERRFGRHRIGDRPAFVQQQARAKTASADICAQHRLRQRHPLGVAGRDINPEVAAVVTVGHL